MKYVVLSFDDGYSDFLQNALKIINEYGFKATLNIVSGFADRTIYNSFSCLTVDEIKQLYKEGHEIAAHSNSHMDKENVSDVETSVNKITEWLNLDSIGVVMPKSQDIFPELECFLNESKKVLYYADWRYPKVNMRLKGNICRVINRFATFKTTHIIAYGYRVLYDKKLLAKSYKPRFNRITVKRNRESKYFINLLKAMPNDTAITIVFHSILNNYSEQCDWPEGAWDIAEFSNLLSFIKKTKNIKVVRQCDAIKILSREAK